jgi:hypothetical protein
MPNNEEEVKTEKPSAYLASRYAAHLMGCAEIADAVCQRFGIHGDEARQACFATVVIDAKDRFIFTSDPEKDALAADKADAQIDDAPRKPTAEQAEAAAKTALLEGVKRAAHLLNQEGFTPPMDAKALGDFIVKNLKTDTALESLDLEELESLIKALSNALDVFRKKKSETDVDF